MTSGSEKCVRLISRDNCIKEIPYEAIDELRKRIFGRIIRKKDRDYGEVKKIWNAMFQKSPGLIVRCRGTLDVVETVNFARKHNILFTVRSGGHNITGSSNAGDCMMIDLSEMNGVIVDPKNRIAMAQGGALLGDVDRETQVFGLATPFGVVSKTGIAGLTLGGGYGHLRRQFGLTIDNLVGVEMVLADGRVVFANNQENSNLFWAIRGGGGNFGIVTRFDYRLHPVGPKVAFQYTVYPLEKGLTVFKKGREYMFKKAPLELSAEFQMIKFPDLPTVDQRIRGKRTVVVRSVYSDDPDEGMIICDELRTLEEPLLDETRVEDYVYVQSYKDDELPVGWYYYSTGIMLPDITEDFMKLLLVEYESVPFDFSAVTGVWHTGGAISSVPIDGTAYAARNNNFMVVIDCAWPDKSENETQVAWGRSLKNKIKDLYPGITDTGYINFQTGDDKRAESLAAYGANFHRLQEIKTKYDPDNLFRFNHNIPPLRPSPASAKEK